MAKQPSRLNGRQNSDPNEIRELIQSQNDLLLQLTSDFAKFGLTLASIDKRINEVRETKALVVPPPEPPPEVTSCAPDSDEALGPTSARGNQRGSKTRVRTTSDGAEGQRSDEMNQMNQTAKKLLSPTSPSATSRKGPPKKAVTRLEDEAEDGGVVERVQSKHKTVGDLGAKKKRASRCSNSSRQDPSADPKGEAANVFLPSDATLHSGVKVPQEAQAEQKFGFAVGDRVGRTAGQVGTIVGFTDDEVNVELLDGTCIKKYPAELSKAEQKFGFTVGDSVWRTGADDTRQVGTIVGFTGDEVNVELLEGTCIRSKPTELAKEEREAEKAELSEDIGCSRLMSELSLSATIKPQPTSPEAMQKEFLNAIMQGSEQDVVSLLSSKADPNMVFPEFPCFGRTFLDGAPLAIATLKGHKVLVRLLAESQANPDSGYSFHAGALNVKLFFPASHGTIAGGNLELLQLLIDLRADAHSRCENDASLVWQASYFDQQVILKYLLSMDVSVDAPAWSQDNKDYIYTPLHAATNAGHAHVVEVLLEHQASVGGQNCKGNTPLQDAIKFCHHDLVELLIQHDADLLGVSNPDNNAYDPCDLLFDKGNPLVIAAAAAGLRKVQTDSQIDRLTCSQFVRFLRERGQTPINIVNAVMREHSIRYWEGKERVFVKAGYIDKSYGYNVDVGPHPGYLIDAWNHKMTLPADSRLAFDRLAPQLGDSTSNMDDPIYSSVKVWCCHVPFVQRDIEVLRAFAESIEEGLFDEPATQAIVQLHWQQVAQSSHILMFSEVVYLLLLCFLNTALVEVQNDVSWATPLKIFSWLSLLMWAGLQAVDVMHVVGNISTGNKKVMLLSLQRKLFHHSVRVCAGVMLVIVALRYGIDNSEIDNTKSQPWINAALAILIFFRWMSALYALRAIKPIGIRVLPILRTLRGIGPFCGVLATILIGVIFGYYALGLKPFREAIEVVWGVVFFGVAENEVTGADQSEYYYVVRVGVIILSFGLGLSMMNILIAVLSTEYAKAADNAFRSFMHMRACMAIDHFLILEGFRIIWKCRRVTTNKLTREHNVLQRHSKILEWGAERVHVWFCREKSEE